MGFTPLSIPTRYIAHLGIQPAVPFTGCQYKSTQTQTVDETVTTWTSVAIGTPHPKRIVVLGIFQGVDGNMTSATVNGMEAYFKLNLNEFSIAAIQVPNNTLATITVSATSSVRKACSVYVGYPNNHMPLDSGTNSANAATDANVADQKVQASGFLIYSGGQFGTIGTFTTTWNGADAVVEDTDAQLEAISSYTAGHINITGSTDLSDLNMAESTSGTKRLAVATWGPPRGY